MTWEERRRIVEDHQRSGQPMQKWCKEKGIKQVCLEADPNAQGFYEKLGAVCIGLSTVNLVEGRTIPFMVFDL